MFQNLTGWHALVILAIVLLVFGSSKLPALAKSVGQSMRILKDEVRDSATNTQASAVATAAPATVPATVPATNVVDPLADRRAS
ncbi:MAG: twin-arginine translocase TatA/TatE family subunit [Nocardioidaceae bacterium]